MIDRPDAERLLLAVADALSADVVAALSPGASDPEAAAAARYTVRIAANLCRILAREAALGPQAETATVADLRSLLGRNDGSLEELSAALDETLRDGAVDLDARSVHRVLAASVERRLAIARPSYAGGGSSS